MARSSCQPRSRRSPWSTPPTIRSLSGDQLDATATTVAPVAPRSEVALAPAVTDDALSYRWFSSVGDLIGYTRPAATLSPITGARGYLGLVTRDQAGGTAWTLIPAMVSP